MSFLLRNIFVFFLAPFFLATCNSSLSSSEGEEHDMLLVEGSTFEMGSELSELESIRASTRIDSIEPFRSEVPAHSVRVDDFLIDIYTVTNQDFSLFVEENPEWSKLNADSTLHNGRYLEHWTNGQPPQETLSHPVTFVSWQSAVAYCEWLGKRLPTEAEFEWAAQDGSTQASYPWGDEFPNNSLVNWGFNEIDSTTPVGSYPPNGRGLFDMAGNVWQFTSDPWLGSYTETLQAGTRFQQAALDPSIRRVVRGGSWGANAANLRIKYRDSHRPFDAREMVGFRCAKSVLVN